MTAFEFGNDHLTKISLKEEQLLELTNSLAYETIEAWGTETDTVFATFSVVARRKGQDYVVVLTYHDLDHVILTEGLMNYVALIAWLKAFAENCIALEAMQAKFRNVTTG